MNADRVLPVDGRAGLAWAPALPFIDKRLRPFAARGTPVLRVLNRRAGQRISQGCSDFPRALPSDRRNTTCRTNAVAVTRQNTGRPGNSSRSRPLPTDMSASTTGSRQRLDPHAGDGGTAMHPHRGVFHQPRWHSPQRVCTQYT